MCVCLRTHALTLHPILIGGGGATCAKAQWLYICVFIYGLAKMHIHNKSPSFQHKNEEKYKGTCAICKFLMELVLEIIPIQFSSLIHT